MCDILCTADDITSTISHQTTVFMMSHPLQALHHTPCIRYCTHCIFVITTSPQISHPLLNDITPTFCVISYALYITSHPILLSSHYCTYDITTSIYETTSSKATYTLHMIHHNHYMCPHIHCIDNITPTFVWHHTRHMCGIICPIQDITSSLHDLKSPCLCNHTHYIWYHVHCISVITSILLMISHQLYFWVHICYNSQHHVHCIWHDSHCMTSQPHHSWHQIHYIWHDLHGLWHLVPYTCDIIDTMFVNTCQLYLTSNTRC